MLLLHFYCRAKEQIPESLFTPLLAQAFSILQREKILKPKNTCRLELTIIGPALMKKLNFKHRKKNKPTDVLSLSYFDPKDPDHFAGELFICLDVAKAQAKQLGHTLFEELRFLFVHGLLHLFGFDHKKEKDEKKMTRLTDEILSK